MAEPLQTELKKELLPPELIQLRRHIEKLPAPLRDHLGFLCDRAGHYIQLQARLVKIAQDAVDQLQLDVKYLIFDLEATQRERDTFRHELEELEGFDF